MSEKPQPAPEDASNPQKRRLTKEELIEMARLACLKHGLDPDAVVDETSSPPGKYRITVMFIRTRPPKSDPPISGDSKPTDGEDKES